MLDDMRYLLTGSSELLKRNFRFAILYVASTVIMEGMGVTADIGILSALAALITIYILCGMLGCLRHDILVRREPTFADFHAYANKFFWRALGIVILIGLIVIVPLTVAAMTGMTAALDFSRMHMLLAVLYSGIGAFLILWTAGSVCCMVYYDGAVFDSMKAGIYAAFVNWRICIPLFIYTAFSAALVNLVPEGFTLLMLFVSVSTSVVWAFLIVIAYAYIMINFSRENLPRTVE